MVLEDEDCRMSHGGGKQPEVSFLLITEMVRWRCQLGGLDTRARSSGERLGLEK
jgi:hypothetical protein